MLDIENYKRAVIWMRRSLNELRQDSKDQSAQLVVLHRFEVTHNVTESLLREAYVSLGVDEHTLNLSLRELVRRAADEGIRISSPKQWLEYGLMLESAKETWNETATVDLDTILPIVPRYADELDAFALRLQQRMATFA